jgi:hypothetical protein
MSDHLWFKQPFTCIVSGPTGSGKSTFCIELLQNLESLCTERNFDGGIIGCYSERTAVPSQHLATLKRNIQFHEWEPANFNNAQGRPTLIILDDLLNEVYLKDVSLLFTKGSHYRNISVILITQNLFHQGRNARDISLNAKCLVILKNVRDKNQFTYRARQVFPEDSDGLYKAYQDATQRLHGYLVVDLSQDTHDRLRFRTNIFPSEYPPVIYAAVGYEKIKPNFNALQLLKDAKPKLRKAIITNCTPDLVKCICECAVNVLKGNINLSACANAT